MRYDALTKRYGATTAVSDLTFTVQPGTVTGFLGPNGAGKSTTMRMILGLDEPTSGSVLVNGRPPRAHAAPLHEVGGMLDPRAVHPSRSAYHHLLALAQTSGIRRSRVDEVIDAVGLRAVAGRRAGKFSLGMSQRLGIAAALLGDPATVVLDEPVNGLDVEGIRWIRALLHDLAAQGKTVFVSSHLMSEIAQTATHLIVIGRGGLIADTSVAEFIASAAPPAVRVRSSDQPTLAGLLRSPDVTVAAAEDGALAVSGLTAAQIGAAAADAGITVLELATEQTSLEDAFVDLTQDAVEFRAAARATSEEEQMTSITPNPGAAPAALPGYLAPQRVTQARVLRSEWTKLRTQPSALWALLSAVILIVAFGILYSLLREARPPHGTAAIRSFDPVVGQPVRGAARADRRRGAGGTADHQRVCHRSDPDESGGRAAAAAGLVGQGGDAGRSHRGGEPAGCARGLPGRAVDPGPPAPRGDAQPARRGPRGDRQRAVPGGRRADRPGPGGRAAQHSRRDRGAVRPVVRGPDRGRLPARELVRTRWASTCPPRPARP